MTIERSDTRVKRIVVTGSECTGKTTLAEALAKHYRTVWVPEFSRRFVVGKGAPPGPEDVEPIARGQIALEDEIAASASSVVFQDTDLLSTVIYRTHYYGSCPAWIEEELAKRPAELYLLAHIDVPWEPEGDLRDRGHMREEMQQLFVDALLDRQFCFVEIRGLHAVRLEGATRAIDDLVAAGLIEGEGL